MVSVPSVPHFGTTKDQVQVARCCRKRRRAGEVVFEGFKVLEKIAWKTMAFNLLVLSREWMGMGVCWEYF